MGAPETKPQSIFLATDLKPAGDRAFDRAVQLATVWSAQLTVCHVIKASSLHPWGIERRVLNAELEMERLVRNNPLGPKLSRHIVVGDPAERAIEHARAIGSDLLVTGPAYGKELGDRLLGSTAAPHCAPCEPAGPRRSQAAGGGHARVWRASTSHRNRARPSYAVSTCFRRRNSPLIHAYEVKPDWSGRNEHRPIDEVEADETARAAEQDMADLLTDLGQSGGTLGTLLVQGTPEVVAGDYVDKIWPDLIVAGTHGRTGPRGASIGSVVELFLNTLPCDVLAVPTQG